MEPSKTTLTKAIKETRKELLDLLEIAIGESPQWPLVRSRILQIFGRKGLEKFVETQNKERYGKEEEQEFN